MSRKRRGSMSGELGIEEALPDMVAQLRTPKGETNYVIAEFDSIGNKDNRQLGLCSAESGTGGHKALYDKLGSSPGKILFFVLKIVGECNQGTSVEKFIYFRLKTQESRVMLRARSGQFEGQIKKVLGDSFSREINLVDEWEQDFGCDTLAKSLLKNWAGSDKPDRIIMGGGEVFDCTTNQLIMEAEN